MRVWKQIPPYLAPPRSHLASSCRRSSPQLSCVSWTWNRGTNVHLAILTRGKQHFPPLPQPFFITNQVILEKFFLSMLAGRAGRARPRRRRGSAALPLPWEGTRGWGRAQKKPPTWKNTPPAPRKWSPPAPGSAGRSAAPCARCSPQWSLGMG